MIPRSLSLGLGEIENTVTLFFASALAAGSLSLLNLALQLMYLPSRIFGTTIGQASLPILSKNIARNELEIFRSTVQRTILQSLYIALPITTLILIHRVTIVRLAFGAKQFPWSATLLTARLLAFLAPAIICQAVIQILIRSFYALHNTKTPLWVSAASLIANISTSFYFINYTQFGVTGLAISASIGNIVQCFGLLFLFVKQVDGFQWITTLRRFLVILFCSIIMGAISWSSLKIFDLFILDTSRTFSLAIVFITSSIIGLISYFISSSYFKVQEFNDYRHYFSKFTRFLLRRN